MKSFFGGRKLQEADAPQQSKQISQTAVAEQEHFGLERLRNPPDAEVDIVFIHGLMGDLRTTWTHPETGDFWPRDDAFWPESIANKARVFTFGYDTGIFGDSVANMYDACELLNVHLRGYRRGSLRDRPLLFVAHSLGGIVAKLTIIRAFANPDTFDNLATAAKGLILFGTPHTGTQIAQYGETASNVVRFVTFGAIGNHQIVAALRQNSPELNNAAAMFVTHASQLPIYSFYESRRMHGFLIVPQASARMNTVREIALPVPNSDHSEMCKFSRNAPMRFAPVRTALEELVEAVTSTFSIVIDQDDLLRGDSSTQYWDFLTVKGLAMYEKLYDNMRRSSTGHVKFEDFATKVVGTDVSQQQVSIAWNRIIATWAREQNSTQRPAALPKNLILTVLFMLHMEKRNPHIPLRSRYSDVEISHQRWRTITRFGNWIPCQCAECNYVDCQGEWNFGREGSLRRGPNAIFCQANAPYPSVMVVKENKRKFFEVRRQEPICI